MMRTSSRMGLLSPTRSITLSSRKRSSLDCAVADSSPISSRNRVPPSASSNLPALSRTAPVKAPRTCPNTSDSKRFSAIAVQVTSTNGLSARADLLWMDRASSVLPDPVSPDRSTVASLGAIRSTTDWRAWHFGEVSPSNQSPDPARKREFSRWRSTSISTLRMRCSNCSVVNGFGK